MHKVIDCHLPGITEDITSLSKIIFEYSETYWESFSQHSCQFRIYYLYFAHLRFIIKFLFIKFEPLIINSHPFKKSCIYLLHSYDVDYINTQVINFIIIIIKNFLGILLIIRMQAATSLYMFLFTISIFMWATVVNTWVPWTWVINGVTETPLHHLHGHTLYCTCYPMLEFTWKGVIIGIGDRVYTYRNTTEVGKCPAMPSSPRQLFLVLVVHL